MIKIFTALMMVLLLIGCVTTKNNSNSHIAADSNIQLGVAYLQQKKMARAKQKLLLALQQAPDYSPCWYTMGYFLENTGESEAASRYYQRALTLAPYDGAAHNNYGTFLCRQGHYRAAIEHFLIAIRDVAYLNTAAAYRNAAKCALKIPDKKLANEFFGKGLRQRHPILLNK